MWHHSLEEFEDAKRGNQNPWIEGQTTQRPKEKGQKDKQRSTKHTHKTKARVTRTPLKPGVNSGAPEGYEVPAPLVDMLVTHMTIKLPGCGYTTQGSL